MANRDYPNKARLSRDLEKEIRIVLDKHYALVDAHAQTLAQLQALQDQVAKAASSPPRGTGPSDSRMLGLPVAPIDPQALANGATLKFDKTNGQLKFS